MDELFAIRHSYLIPLLPLLGAMIAGFFGARWLKGKSHWPIWIGVGSSAVLSFMLLFGMLRHMPEHHAADAGHGGLALSAESRTVGVNKVFFNWITSGNPDNAPHDRFFNAEAGFWFDPLTAVMLCVVCGIGFLITVFSAGYMKGEPGYFRFFSYLGLFIFAMTCLVMGNNLLMLYLGWEGVGVCSYLLIGYYYERPSAREAAKKAFLVNRIGDFGFGLGIMLCFMAFGTIKYFSGDAAHTGLLELVQNPALSEFQRQALNWIPFLLMMGAFGKSAQFPLHVWLPDAMEGPTPVSALIHAATMVTAGVYMIVRCGTLFVGNSAAMWTIAIVGCFTALFAGTIALRQFDLKKVFAYSTISQLGFMFVAAGCFAPVAAVFHLVTHAFFKALLFLSSGVVMHATGGELDLSKMSGMKAILPKTRWLMLIGCAALSGLPPLAGYFSKDEIIAASYFQSRLLAAMMLIAAFMTAYYSFRLYFRVFEGPLVVPPPPAHDPHHAVDHDAEEEHAAGHHHDHEPMIMIAPLVILALGAIFAGALAYHHAIGNFLGASPSVAQAYHMAQRVHGPRGKDMHPLQFGQHDVQLEIEKLSKEFVAHEHHVHLTLMIVSALIAGCGVYLAYLMHLRDRNAGDKLAVRFRGAARIFEAKYWIDEVYQNGIVEPLRAAGRGLFMFDRLVVDGLVRVFGFSPHAAGWVVRFTTQRGYLQGYAVMMLLGITAILVFVFYT
ncbi:MAG: NADH-quinone oxidoreductase subunit [Humisphaera sp.]|nr:NADH-quinone oxidoreductase subunit [Humisphaera sp.]